MSEEKINRAEYNYRHFHPELMVERFEGGPKPGEMAGDFTATTPQGEEIQLSDFRGWRHVVIQFGSVT